MDVFGNVFDAVFGDVFAEAALPRGDVFGDVFNCVFGEVFGHTCDETPGVTVYNYWGIELAENQTFAFNISETTT